MRDLASRTDDAISVYYVHLVSNINLALVPNGQLDEEGIVHSRFLRLPTLSMPWLSFKPSDVV